MTMRLVLVQLSDIHFHADNNWISDKTARIAGAVHAEDPTVSGCILLFRGDIAFSGKRSEYEQASRFSQGLKSAFMSYGGPDVAVVIVPGNHDCDFDRESDTRHMALSNMTKSLAALSLSGDIVRQCVAVQDEFFTFLAQETGMPSLSTPNRLFYTSEHDFDGFRLRLNSYNTSWLSQKHEHQGELLYPVDAVAPLISSLPHANIVLSLLHHPYNWFASNNGRDLKKLVEATSDVVLTGHEHEVEIYSKVSLSGPELKYLEGAVLQTSPNSTSGFNILHLDAATLEYRFTSLSWKSGMYQCVEASPWVPIKRQAPVTGEHFDNKPEYEKMLHDIGTGFTHPRVKSALRLEDLFIYPDLVRRSFQKSDQGAGGRMVESKNVVAKLLEFRRSVIAGSDLSGKSTLARSLYCDLRAKGLVPVALSGRALNARNQTEVQRVLDSAVSEQYGSVFVAAFNQLRPDRRAVIIDDFDHCYLNPKGQRQFLEIARAIFDTIIIIADEFFALEELSQQAQDNRLFYDFESLEIREFGYFLRGKLIEKWVTLGREHSISRAELDHEVHTHENLIGSLLGRNLLPSHPLTILTILQAWEATQSHDTNTGSYGFLYETLILQALATAGFKAPEIDVIMTFLARIAYRMFEGDREDLGEMDVDQVSRDYVEYYKIRLPRDMFDRLDDARILHKEDGQYSFRYPYCFYFFVARYIRDNMSSLTRGAALSETVAEMVDHVHYERYANVLSFYVYLSKDERAIAAVVKNARLIYEEHPPCDFDSTVSFVNDLYLNRRAKQPDSLLLPPSSPQVNRDELKRELDKTDEQREEGLEQRRNERVKYDKQLSDVIKINIATKTLQILGQVVRNSPGSLPGNIKRDVAAEAYALGLRSLTAVLGISANNLEGLRQYLMDMIREYRLTHKRSEVIDKDLEKMADEGVIQLAQACAHGMLRRISQCIGLTQLEDIYSEILSQSDGKISVRLIDLAIKLDHFADPPLGAVAELDVALKGNHYAHRTLQDLVFGFLYLRDVDFKARSKRMSRFKIQGGATKMLVDNPSKRERR